MLILTPWDLCNSDLPYSHLMFCELNCKSEEGEPVEGGIRGKVAVANARGSNSIGWW